MLLCIHGVTEMKCKQVGSVQTQQRQNETAGQWTVGLVTVFTVDGKVKSVQVTEKWEALPVRAGEE